MKTNQFILVVLFILLTPSLHIKGQEVIVSGTVYNDKNQNGIKDKSEKGIKNVLISNGENIVLSDKNGNYTINVTLGSSLFPMPSSQYEIIRKKGERVPNSAFLYIDTAIYKEVESIKFNIPLQRVTQKKDFRIGAIGDLQVKNLPEINYANQSLMAELSERQDIDFNIFLGDQINDALELFPYVKQMIDRLTIPSWILLGNHDRNTENINYQDDEFNRNFGASHYAFNYGNVHFIVLNNIYSEGGRQYKGLISEKQLEFVKNNLEYVSHNKTIVICQHIPMIYTQNKESLLELVKKYDRVLILSGHTHQISRHILAENVHELVAGASCGNWWVGERDWQSIPSALMQCGSPKNYFTIDFSTDDYKINYKGIGLDANMQMDIWINGQDTIDAHNDDLNKLDENLLVVNIYGGSDSTKVFMQIDNGECLEMTKTLMVAPTVSRLAFLNSQKVYPTLYSRRAAIRKKKSPHIWTALLPLDLSSGIHSVKIQAEDRYGFNVSSTKLIIYK